MIHKCLACEYESTDEEEFTLDRRSRKGRRSQCKRCEAARVNTWQVKKRAELRELVTEAKSVPCADCGEKYPTYVMDFDHVRGEKSFSIGKALGSTPSVEVVSREIAKCDVVCANCHRERTFGSGNWNPRKRWLESKMA